ncbi:hypothetical protein, partial [Novosphingobium sp.]|uniref:hypothetical protein n=1 Tax=Novosphingobium sp. TaxID=1874826 RepID=UPI0039182320
MPRTADHRQRYAGRRRPADLGSVLETAQRGAGAGRISQPRLATRAPRPDREFQRGACRGCDLQGLAVLESPPLSVRGRAGAQCALRSA